ncbi:MAG: hypothetical protein DRR11_20595 [Gammaproteobacteria bacterium]|nr:MAG: hypothetical protein DRR11_20595 [Gammaproteobacteria bacterium]RLA29871.1 MAG: hypothetical protein DRR15_15745 [Gammaproteobacteria bacterium]
MKVYPNRNLFKPALLILAMWLLPAAPAAADVNKAIADLKACVTENLADERKKEQPTAAAMLKKCNSKYQALRRELPKGALDRADHHVRFDIEFLLSGS